MNIFKESKIWVNNLCLCSRVAFYKAYQWRQRDPSLGLTSHNVSLG